MIASLAKIGAGIIALIWFNRLRSAAPLDDTTPIDNTVPVVPPIPDPVPALPIPAVPGDSYSNPESSANLKPGFKGFFQVQSGDSLIGIMRRLGHIDADWRLMVLLPENQWAVELCPQDIRLKYYGGWRGISLTRQYGTVPGKNCVAPGYGPGFPLLTTASGVFPVLYWNGE